MHIKIQVDKSYLVELETNTIVIQHIANGIDPKYDMKCVTVSENGRQ